MQFADGAGPIPNGRLEPFEIRDVRLVLAERSTQVLEKQRRTAVVWLNETVIHAVATPPIQYESGTLEIVQVARDGRLGDVQNVLDVAASQLALKQQIENTQARPVREAHETLFERHRSRFYLTSDLCA